MGRRIHWAWDGSLGYIYTPGAGGPGGTDGTKSAISSTTRDILDGDNLISSSYSTPGGGLYFLINFPNPLDLEKINIKTGDSVNPYYIYTSSDSTDGIDGTWVQKVNNTLTASAYTSFTFTANGTKWVRIGPTINGTSKYYYCIHIFGQYQSPDFELWDSTGSARLTGDYPLATADAPNTAAYAGVSAGFKIKNTDTTASHDFSLTVKKVKYTSDTTITNNYTLSKDGGSTKNSTITVTGVAADSLCTETIKVYADVAQIDNPANGYHYFVVDVTRTA